MTVDHYVQATRAFYSREVDHHGFDHKGLGFRRRAAQQARFEVIAGVTRLDGVRLLDVGAGLGDFYFFLRERGISVEYTGLELCDHLATEARRRLAREPQCRVITGDVLDFTVGVPYDVVVASGIFGLETGRTRDRIAPTLSRLFAMSRHATAVNFLSTKATAHAERSHYVPPEELLERALALTPSVVMRHDYLANDFTLYLYRNPAWDGLAQDPDERKGANEKSP
jgi:hypothetical protein